MKIGQKLVSVKGDNPKVDLVSIDLGLIYRGWI